jgi:hypothetical protein
MTDDQHAKLASHGATDTVLAAHLDPLAPIPAAQRAITDFRARLTDLRDAARAQTDYTPRGQAKDALREALADAAVPVAQALAAWADEHDDLTLEAEMDLTRTDFTRAREQDALDRAALVHAAASARAEDLADFGVTPADLAALDAALDAFAAALSEPRHAIIERVAQTEAIARLFAEIDRILTGRLDRIVARFEGTPFHAEYRAARCIVDR